MAQLQLSNLISPNTTGRIINAFETGRKSRMIDEDRAYEQQQREQQADQQLKLSNLTNNAVNAPNTQAQQSALKQLISYNPKLGASVTKALQAVNQMDDNSKAIEAEKGKHLYGFANYVMQGQSREDIYNRINQGAQAMDQLGIDVSMFGDLNPVSLKAISEYGATLFEEASAPTSLQNDLIAAGYKPGTPEFKQAILDKHNKPQTQVNMESEREESKARGKQLVSQFGSISERANAASDNLEQLHISKNIDVSTGALEPLKKSVASFAQGLGFNPENLGLENATNAEAFTGIMQNLVLTKMQAQKGPQTENDAKRIENTLASLGNTPQARVFLTNAAIAIEERRIEQRNFYLDWEEKNGSFKGAEQSWDQHKRNTPLFGVNPNTNRPVFYNEFFSKMREANPNADSGEILDLWRVKYNGANRSL